MKKRVLCCLVTMACVSIFNIQAMARIDDSVFRNNDDYIVEIDDFDDTGTIQFAGGDGKPSRYVIGTTGDDDEGTLWGYYDIKMVDNGDMAVPRITLLYTGEDWIFTDKVIVKTDSHRYTFEVDRDTDVDGGKIYEMYTLVLHDESLQLLKDIIDEDSIMVEFRFSGDRKVDGKFLFIPEDLKEFYDDFVTAGGLEQDFSSLHVSFPCEIKEL